ncbi:uncharacterized protein [Cicer arietinum]|uniref:uncharacterized protein isoform X2 n=1 Tax=Cicer arietinum TaxID=3827 RepID=UPI003CC6DB3A
MLMTRARIFISLSILVATANENNISATTLRDVVAATELDFLNFVRLKALHQGVPNIMMERNGSWHVKGIIENQQNKHPIVVAAATASAIEAVVAAAQVAVAAVRQIYFKLRQKKAGHVENSLSNSKPDKSITKKTEDITNKKQSPRTELVADNTRKQTQIFSNIIGHSKNSYLVLIQTQHRLESRRI